MMLKRTVAATTSAISLHDAIEHLRLNSGDEDYLVSAILAASIEIVGEKAGRVMAPETWEMSFETASGDVVLPKSPVIAVTGISYYDATDTLQAATVADFYLFKDDDRAILRPKSGKSWPSAITRDDAIKITFTAGYTVIPSALRSAALLVLGHLYLNREAVAENLVELPMGVEMCINQSRLGWVAG